MTLTEQLDVNGLKLDLLNLRMQNASLLSEKLLREREELKQALAAEDEALKQPVA